MTPLISQGCHPSIRNKVVSFAKTAELACSFFFAHIRPFFLIFNQCKSCQMQKRAEKKKPSKGLILIPNF